MTGNAGACVGLLAVALSLLPWSPSVPSRSGEPPEDRAFREEAVPLLAEHCVKCHGPKRRKGGLDLSGFRTGAAVRAEPEIWRRVLTQVRSGAMPPGRAPRLDESSREQLWRTASAALSWRDPAAPRDPGVVTLRRLNRYEYDRTVRALLDVDYDSSRTFPAEPAAYGFDNVGDVLFLTPMLVEKYHDATREIVQRLYEDSTKVDRLWGALPVVDEDAVVRRRIEGVVRRAFRRPVTEEDVAPRLALYRAARRDRSPAEALRPVLETVLLSPHFLFRVEEERDEDSPWALPAHEVATRLAYFLWSAPPDESLATLARTGELRDADVLVREVRRMVKDPRARALADHFAAQWLGFREIKTHAVDVRRFRGFHGALRHALYEESARFFMTLVTENLPVTTLIDADFTFLNQDLAKHYGIKGVEGRELRRVQLDEGLRGGVLGMGSILTVTSHPLRTSPVLRGKWVLETLLGVEAPPPPPDAGALPKDDKQKDGLSLRERLERHRSDPRCAACHARMDAFGLALERFDGVGRARTENHGNAIDARAELPGGVVVDGPEGLRAWLAERKERVVRSLIESLLVYALGREVTPDDEATVRALMARAAKDEYRMLSVLEGVATSYPFLHKRKP